jgi:chromosomal replication initiation ATPase DnaA
MSCKTSRLRKLHELKDAELHLKKCFEYSQHGIEELKLTEFSDLLNRVLITRDILVAQFEKLYPEVATKRIFSLSKFNEIKELFDTHFPTYKNKNRRYPNVIYKHCFFYIAKKHTLMPYKAIGESIGSYDHSTVISAKNVVIKEIETGNENYIEVIRFIESRLNNESTLQIAS